MALAGVFILIPLVFGMIQTARICMVSQLLTNAAREGCRVAVTNNMTSADVTNRVNTVLANTGIAPTITLSPTVLHWISDSQPGTAYNDPNPTISLTLSVSFQKVSWLPTVYPLTNLQLTATSKSGASTPGR